LTAKANALAVNIHPNRKKGGLMRVSPIEMINILSKEATE